MNKILAFLFSNIITLFPTLNADDLVIGWKYGLKFNITVLDCKEKPLTDVMYVSTEYFSEINL